VRSATEGNDDASALTDDTDEPDYVPLHAGLTSIEVVAEQNQHAGSAPASVNECYLARLALAPGVVRLASADGLLIESPRYDHEEVGERARCTLRRIVAIPMSWVRKRGMTLRRRCTRLFPTSSVH
jgi:hypothetical protein